ncbi:MAG: RNase adapter RapZ [Synergistes sp.]|nr:RNase adapter RapZ [Synergistes sp.]
MSNTEIRCVVITGLSGSGKTSALNVLEDMGYYAANNVPMEIVPELITLLINKTPSCDKIAVVGNLHEESDVSVFFSVLDKIKSNGIKLKTLFMNASDETILRRYETSRRRHYFANGVALLQAIAAERNVLKVVKEKCDAEIMTDDISLTGLRALITENLMLEETTSSIVVSSFGFKYGIPSDADYVFDVRFLPNPNYIPELHDLSGKDLPVRTYMESFSSLSDFRDRLIPLVKYISSVYSQTAKRQMHIAFGCTGGRHRSVMLAETVGKMLAKSGCSVSIIHRDIDRGVSD